MTTNMFHFPSRFFPHSCLITGFETRLTWRVPLVEQQLLTLPEHLSSSLVFSGVRATRLLALCVRFIDRCLSFCSFSFGHCVVCSSSIYGFWLRLWYLQILLILTVGWRLRLHHRIALEPIETGDNSHSNFTFSTFLSTISRAKCIVSVCL